MTFEGLPADSGGSLLVVPGELAARQWELTLLDDPGRADARAWVSPALVTPRRWLRELHAHRPDAAPVIGRAQREALWRRVAEASAERLGLVNSRGPAGWAAQADELLAEWRIDAAGLEAAPDSDFGVFLAWRAEYRAELAAAGWLDDTDLVARLDTLPLAVPAHAAWLDRPAPTPAEQALAARLEAAGCRVKHRQPPRRRGRARRVRFADPATELRAAARWLGARGPAAGAGRTALVVPDLARREREVARVLDEALGGAGDAPAAHVWIDGGGVLAHEPAVGAAVQGIELTTPHGAFEQLSRWLRSPFFQGRDPAAAGAAARAEARLRASLLSQLRVGDAARDAELIATLDEHAPASGTRLKRALENTGPAGVTRTPTQWVGLWQRGLRALGWPAADVVIPERARLGWEAALGELAELSPMLGAIGAGEALAELRAILARRRVDGPLPAAGVHVFARPEAVGPGYDACWVTGLTDRSWPEPPRLNPLLPRRLQVEHGMPGATPRAAWQHAADTTRALVERVDEAIFSWPEHVDEQVTEPSSLLTDIEETDAAALGVDADAAPPTARFEPRALERPVDPAPPLTATRIRGGARTLDLQARAPLLAFCESRLHTRPLERPARGLPPRIFGIAAHAALHALGRAHPTQTQWCAPAEPAARAPLERAVDAALAAGFGHCRDPLRALHDLERERLLALLLALLEREAERDPFTIAAVEEQRRIGIAGHELDCRIDRVDRLGDDTLVVLDYKTGRAAPGWLDERLGDTQLPLYALEQSAPVAATAIVALGRARIAYAGLGRAADAFPDRGVKALEAAAWDAQLERWRAQIEALMAEYAAGDVRILDAALDAVRGDYAPLARIREHAAAVGA